VSEDIFTSDQSGQGGEVDNPLEALVGEGKKYRTVEDLAKSRVEADRFIEQLKMEKEATLKDLENYKARADQGATLKEIMEAIKGQTSNSGSDGESNNQNLNPEELRKLVGDVVNDYDSSKRRASNRTEANQKVVSMFDGDTAKAKAHIEVRAKELGMTTNDLGSLSETSPEAFARLVGITQPKQSSGGSPASIADKNTTALTDVPAGDRDQDFYRKLRKDNPKEFYSPKMQQELFRLGTEKGVEFVQGILSN
jgi:hypothetical protein